MKEFAGTLTIFGNLITTLFIKICSNFRLYLVQTYLLITFEVINHEMCMVLIYNRQFREH